MNMEKVTAQNRVIAVISGYEGRIVDAQHPALS